MSELISSTETQGLPASYSLGTIPLSMPSPSATASAPVSNRNEQHAEAVTQALSKYPWLRKLGPLALVQGTGPGESETYLPQDSDNPVPDHFTVQLRSARSSNNPNLWVDTLASEGLHGLQARDPIYQQFTKEFVSSMTPDQIADSRRAYQEDKKIFGDDGEPFQQWLPRVQAQEYIRGFVFPALNPGWTGPRGEGGYTPFQQKLLQRLKERLSPNDEQPRSAR